MTPAAIACMFTEDHLRKHAYFDPSSNDVRSAVLAAIHAVLTAYPFDGIFLDNYDVQNAMLLDTQGTNTSARPDKCGTPPITHRSSPP